MAVTFLRLFLRSLHVSEVTACSNAWDTGMQKREFLYYPSLRLKKWAKRTLSNTLVPHKNKGIDCSFPQVSINKVTFSSFLCNTRKQSCLLVSWNFSLGLFLGHFMSFPALRPNLLADRFHLLNSVLRPREGSNTHNWKCKSTSPFEKPLLVG